jgi:hypothetical protein
MGKRGGEVKIVLCLPPLPVYMLKSSQGDGIRRWTVWGGLHPFHLNPEYD